MIVVRVLLRPGGDPRAERTLGEVQLENVNGPVDAPTYRAEAHDLTDDTRVFFSYTHPSRLGFWSLAAKALGTRALTAAPRRRLK